MTFNYTFRTLRLQIIQVTRCFYLRLMEKKNKVIPLSSAKLDFFSLRICICTSFCTILLRAIKHTRVTCKPALTNAAIWAATRMNQRAMCARERSARVQERKWIQSSPLPPHHFMSKTQWDILRKKNWRVSIQFSDNYNVLAR